MYDQTLLCSALCNIEHERSTKWLSKSQTRSSLLNFGTHGAVKNGRSIPVRNDWRDYWVTTMLSIQFWQNSPLKYNPYIVLLFCTEKPSIGSRYFVNRYFQTSSTLSVLLNIAAWKYCCFIKLETFNKKVVPHCYKLIAGVSCVSLSHILFKMASTYSVRQVKQFVGKIYHVCRIIGKTIHRTLFSCYSR